MKKIKYLAIKKTVRDNIHSFDLVNCFMSSKKSKIGEVYNIEVEYIPTAQC